MPLFGQRALVLPLPFVLLLCGCPQEAPAPSPERSAALLISLLTDKSAELRRTAAESLGKIGDGSAASKVLPLLSDPLPLVRAAAAQALGRIGAASDEAIIVGLSRSLADPADSVRQAAAIAIGDLEPSSRQLAGLVPFLHASDVQVRRAAIYAALPLDTGSLMTVLLPLLNDPDAEVRQGAVAALAASGDPRAGPALQQRLTRDISGAVRAEAAYHLGEVTGTDAGSVLRSAAAQEPDGGVRRWIEAEIRSLHAND